MEVLKLVFRLILMGGLSVTFNKIARDASPKGVRKCVLLLLSFVLLTVQGPSFYRYDATSGLCFYRMDWPYLWGNLDFRWIGVGYGFKFYTVFLNNKSKVANRVVSVTVRPVISNCTGDIYYTDIQLQEGRILTSYTPHVSAMINAYSKSPNYHNGIVRSNATVIVLISEQHRLD